MATKLDLYNDALLLAGERFLGSLTENREPRRLLDQVWVSAVAFCLEQGQWSFAKRTVQIDYDPNVEPDFGYPRAFEKPGDWVNTSAVCADEFFVTPLTRYSDEAGYWYADLDTIYVKFVSNNQYYGMNLGSWPATFADYVAAHLASRIVLKLSNSSDREEELEKEATKRLMVAKNKSAMTEPTSFPPRGAWSNARNRFPNRRDGGNPSGSSGPLIG